MGTNKWPVIAGNITGFICICKQLLLYTFLTKHIRCTKITFFFFLNRDMSMIFLIKHFYFNIIILLKVNWYVPRTLFQCSVMSCYIYPTKMMPHEVVQHSLGHAFVPEMPCVQFLITPFNPSSLC